MHNQPDDMKPSSSFDLPFDFQTSVTVTDVAQDTGAQRQSLFKTTESSTSGTGSRALSKIYGIIEGEWDGTRDNRSADKNSTMNWEYHPVE